MKRALRVRCAGGLLACAAWLGSGCSAGGDGYREDANVAEVTGATTCSPKLVYYPVQGAHNNGYDSTAGNSSLWSCDDAYSNSDYYSQHLGNDIWAAEGTPVVATVDGTLLLVGYSSYSGNKVTIKDSCGWYHFNCHLQTIAPGISNGNWVTAGTVIGTVGKTGSASNGVVHLHYSIYPDGNYDAGIDPHPYLHPVEHGVCGPTVPATCDRSAGGFTFSCDGAPADMVCVNVDEPGDPDTWSDNYFCSELDLGMQWSAAGPIAGMECTAVNEAAEPNAAAWSDNYLCVPPQSPFALSYSSAGPIADKSCVHWNEPMDLANSWSDNYVCAEPVHVFSAGGFTFSAAGPVDGKHCVVVDEPGDPDTWSDNHFCSDEDLGMQWSIAGPIDGMECTNVTEAADAEADMWTDNYLCLPTGAQYAFTWSSAGPVDGQTCVRWFDHSESSTWIDNWMCIESLAPAPGSGGSGGNGSVGGGSGSAGDGAGGSQQTHVSSADDAGGCSIGSRGQASTRAEMLALLAVLALGRRRRRPGAR
jgi:hypothetical protein